MRRGFLIMLAAVCAISAGCVLHPVRTDALPPVDLVGTFSQEGESGGADRWWLQMNDETLTKLIERALARNFDLRQAAARLEQVQQLAVQAGAPLWPWLSGEGSATRSRTLNSFDSSNPMQTVSTGNLFSVTFSASYEVDLWRRVRSQRDAAWLDVIASREDLNAFAITLAANVAETWYAMVEQHAQLNLLAEQIDASKTYLDLTELRFGQGLASALDVYQQRTHLATMRGQVPAVRARLEVLRNQLSVLLGESPQNATAPESSSLPDLRALPALGLPAGLLRRRPDLRAVHARLVAADHRIASAIADRLPALRLTASSTHASVRAGDIFNNWIWTLAGNLTQPIFEGGRLKAEVARQRAARAETLNAYASATLGAFREVEDALAQERRQRESIAELEKQVDLADKQLGEARHRYVNGLSEFLPVLTAQQTFHDRQRALLTARRQLVSYRIQLYRALGGTWPSDLDAGRLMTTGADGDT